MVRTIGGVRGRKSTVGPDDPGKSAGRQAAVGAVDLADGGLSGNHTLQPGAEFRHYENQV